MGFSIHGFSLFFLRTVKLYFSVPVELYTAYSGQGTGLKPGQKPGQIRSNFNSRGVNSRELFRFFGHNSLSYHAIWTKIGGNLPTDLPDLPVTSKPTKKLKKNKKIENTILKFLKNLHDYLR